MLSAENVPPYDRVKLSKMLNATSDQLKLRQDEFYKVNLKLNSLIFVL